MAMDLIESFKAAWRAAVPLVAVQTPDPAATVKALAESLNGGACVVQWDLVRGCTAVTEAGKPVAAKMEGGESPTAGQPVAMLVAAQLVPAKTVMFLHAAHEFLEGAGYNPMVVQAIWNLRDPFKASRRMLVMLAPSIKLPASLKGDVVVLDEALPGPEELAGIVSKLDESQGVCPECRGTGRMMGAPCDKCGGSGKRPRKAATPEVVQRAVSAVRGLAAFEAEQATAMSLRPEGIDLDYLWESKRRQIELTPGLSVWRGSQTFDDVKGAANVTGFLRRVWDGLRPPRGIFWVDEGEKMFAGSSGESHDSGVSSGILQKMLTHMTNTNVRGMIFVGPPGVGKSYVAQTAGRTFGVLTVALDTNSMKASYVGESERNVTAALKVETSVTDGESLWIMTCNEVDNLPMALRRRFNYGIWMFDFPDLTEREAVWSYYRSKCALTKKQMAPVNDIGWTPAEIRTCCELAADLRVTTAESAKYVIPVYQADRKRVDALRHNADGNYIAANHPGPYRFCELDAPAVNGERAVTMD